MILGMSGVHAQVPDGVRALQLQRDQQQSESVLRSQQFQREALQPPSPATAVQERALLDQAQRQQQQQLFQQQQVQGTMGETTVAPSAAARERQQQQQFDRERQQQLNRFEAERALQDAARR
jgi:hypothetical protein